MALVKEQRLIIGLSASLMLIVFMAHNPFSGYFTSYTNNQIIIHTLHKCTDKDKVLYRVKLMKTRSLLLSSTMKNQSDSMDTIEQKVSNCHLKPKKWQWDKDDKYINQPEFTEPKVFYLDFNEWSTNKPLIPWFGDVTHVLILAASIISICTLFVYFVFQPDDS